MDQNSEDEWEYIFDENETETFVLTVDLSAAATGANVNSTGKANKKNDQQSEDPIHAQSDLAADADAAQDKPSSVQFLDLPSSVPYISYKGQIFTGTWGQTLGSDLIFAAGDDIPDDVQPVMHSQDDQWCLLGVSNTTLVAKRMELVKRSAMQTQSLSAVTNGSSMSNNQEELNDESSDQQSKPFSIVLQQDVDIRQKRQATFLEKLMVAKLARGEKDTVYLGRAKYIDATGKVHKTAYIPKRDWEEMDGVQDDGGGIPSRKSRRGNVSPSQNLSTQDSLGDDNGEYQDDHDIQDAAEQGSQEPQNEVDEPELDDEVQDNASVVDSDNGSDAESS